MSTKADRARDWELLCQEEGCREVRWTDVRCLRTRQVDAGPMRYVEVYPVTRTRGSVRRAKARVTREAQQKVNRRRARERVEQLIHENFTEGDTFLTLTYRNEDARIGEDEVRRDARNYVRALKRLAKKTGRELKYLYVMELPEKQDWDARSYRESAGWHIHMVISGVDRDAAESLWQYGYSDGRRLQDSTERFTALARYMTKRRDSARLWARSRNLREPRVRITDRRPAKAALDRIARSARADGRAMVEQIMPGYRCLEDPTVTVCDWIDGCYLRVRMRRVT